MSYFISTDPSTNRPTEVFDGFGLHPSKEFLKALIELCIETIENYEHSEDHNAYIEHCHINRIDPSTGKPYKHANVQNENKPVDGWVYIAKDESLGLLKIGYSSKPSYRERTLQAEKPTIVFIHAIRGTPAGEKTVHKILKDKRVRGEWFKVTEEEALKAFESIDPGGSEVLFMPDTDLCDRIRYTS